MSSCPLLLLPASILWNVIGLEMLDLNDIAILEIAMVNYQLEATFQKFRDINWRRSLQNNPSFSFNHNLHNQNQNQIIKPITYPVAVWITNRNIRFPNIIWRGYIEELEEYLHLQGSHVLSLDIHENRSDSLPIMTWERILHHCPNLEKVRMNIRIEDREDINQFQRNLVLISQHCNKLTQLTIETLPHQLPYQFISWTKIMKLWPKLTSISSESLSYSMPMSIPVLVTDPVTDLITYPIHTSQSDNPYRFIQHLKFIPPLVCNLYYNRSIELSLLKSCINLTHLELVAVINRNFITEISKCCPNLKYFHFSSQDCATQLYSLSENCKQLQTLKIQSIFSFQSYDIADSEIFHFQNLKSLTLKYRILHEETMRSELANHVATVPKSTLFRRLFQGCPNLTELHIIDFIRDSIHDGSPDGSYDSNYDHNSESRGAFRYHDIYEVDHILRIISQYCPKLLTFSINAGKPWNRCSHDIFQIVSTACPRLNTLTIHEDNISLSSIMDFISSFRHIETLEVSPPQLGFAYLLNGHSNLKSVTLNQALVYPIRDWPEYMKTATTKLGICPKLRTLSIRNYCPFDSWNLINKCVPNLLHLDIDCNSISYQLFESVYELKQLQTFRAKFQATYPVKAFFLFGHHSLQKISIQGTNREVFNVNQSRLQSLVKPLVVAKATVTSNANVNTNRAIPCYPKLRKLSINCDVLDDDIEYISFMIPNLYDLELRSQRITSKSLVALASSCPKLDRISLGSCSRICSVGINALKNKLPHLRFTDLTHCTTLLKETKEMKEKQISQQK